MFEIEQRNYREERGSTLTVLDGGKNSCVSTVNVVSSAGVIDGDQRFPAGRKWTEVDSEEEDMDPTPSSSSSIGKNSYVSGRSSAAKETESDNNEEVQSGYRGPLRGVEALEEFLPIRRGISGFYNGKSKSFTSLADASSIKDIAKPENAYTRRRRNILASNMLCGKNWISQLRKSNGGRISKRLGTSSRAATLALAAAMISSSTKNFNDDMNIPSTHQTVCARPQCNGLYFPSPLGNSAWRSYSLADLQKCDW